MDVGIGLNATIASVDRAALLEWARRAEARGFSTLGTVDRIAYANVEPLVALAAAAAVTEQIRLTTSILLGPLHVNHALLAKQLASIDVLSGGRLTVGIAVGGREDDFKVSGLELAGRGKVLDAQLAALREHWSGAIQDGALNAVGPAPAQAGGPPIIVGGNADAAVRRAVQESGWIAGGGPPFLFQQGAGKVRDAWTAAGRDGEPMLKGLAYFALGADSEAQAQSYLKDYYGFLGPIAEMIANGASTSAAAAQATVAAFADAGCQELIMFPCSSDPAQVDLLADAVL